jgi:PhzF family phenazine biosynthesis protein
MQKLDYYVLDVFTNQRYKGNQLSVVRINHELTDEQYHHIAREFGYSETSFIGMTAEALRVRSFTPARFEVAGAGHNLLGAVCLALLKKWDIFKGQEGQPWVLIKDTKIYLDIAGEHGLPYVGMKQRPAMVVQQVPLSLIFESVGLNPDDLSLRGWPVNVMKTEVPHLMVPVKNREALQRAVPRKALLKKMSERYGFEGFYLFTTEGIPGDYLAEARFFNPGMGIDEDPATGTAAGPLAGYLEQLGYIPKDKEFKILQGAAVEHPSDLRVKVTGEGIWVSGSSTIVMEGVLYL